MKDDKFKTLDANEAVANVAYRINEVISIYPITPSSNMGEWSDEFMAKGITNIWGVVPSVVEMQSEGGAAGSLHGSLQAGTLGTTFTASQGLLLMIPNMYKIAGELTPTVLHVTARTIATHALSIFGDHGDVMATRQTGFALLSSGSVQEAMDFALISQKASMESRIPFLHFFDGFRTSHEVLKIKVVSEETMKAMMDPKLIEAIRNRRLTPDKPVIRGTAQNPDVYFQGRERSNPFYEACPDFVQKAMDEFAKLTGRQYQLFQYYGAKDADKVIVVMASGGEIAHETVDYLLSKGEKVGVLKVKLYRPFDIKRFMEALPASVKKIAVLDRTKESGATGDPLYLDVIDALHQGIEKGYGPVKAMPNVVGGRYGLSSKEFTPAMVKVIYDNLAQKEPKNHFTIGINDDVTHTSLSYDENFSTEPDSVKRCIFYGLGSDGTVGANKNSIKIIGENTDNYAQGYFVYDSKKAGAITVSHLRFGPKEIRSSYLITKANFVACHQTVFIERYDMLQNVVEGGVFLLNTPYDKDNAWNHLPKIVQQQMIDKKVRFYVIDAYKVAQDTGMDTRINTIMQTCFFRISGVLPEDKAIEHIKNAVKKTYGKKGEEIVKKNIDAIDHTLSHLFQVTIPATATSTIEMPDAVSKSAPAIVREVLGEIYAGRGEALKVSQMPVDGTFPTATSQWEKRNIAQSVPEWDSATCIQCGKCSAVCPHAVIRMKVYDPSYLAKAPKTFKSTDPKNKEFAGQKFTLQVAVEDCTGCGACVNICPAKNKTNKEMKAINLVPQAPLKMQERENWEFFLSIPDVDRCKVKPGVLREMQLLKPLFEFSGACAGCGETPYIKMVSQLFGDRSVIANATGCTSIYGANLPTTPYCVDVNGRGPAWANSLFEDNAEFGMGMRMSLDKQVEIACFLLKKLASELGENIVNELINAEQKDETGIAKQRERVAELKKKLAGINSEDARSLMTISDMLVKKSVWIFGGDGWAYDIGFGGLDHVLASGRNVNVLVLDTEVYSNTGGQMSKATPRGAVARFAMGGKPARKKDLGMIAMSYGNVYVASISMGSRDDHALKAILEAEAYNGPSLIIAYSHCIAHGINMTTGMDNQKLAVNCGQWLLYRYNPDLTAEGKNPLILDSKKPTVPVIDFLNNENRFKMLAKSKPEEAKRLFEQAQKDVDERYAYYEYLAARTLGVPAN